MLILACQITNYKDPLVIFTSSSWVPIHVDQLRIRCPVLAGQVDNTATSGRWCRIYTLVIVLLLISSVDEELFLYLFYLHLSIYRKLITNICANVEIEEIYVNVLFVIPLS